MSHDRKKFSYAQVAQYFRDQGCELLAEEYKNSQTKMRYRCSCGTISEINLNNFKHGKRCGCGRIAMKRLKPEEVKQEVISLGYDFISYEYKPESGHILTCRCGCGLERTCKLESFRRSPRCHKCGCRSFTLTYDEVKKYFHEQGCELLSDAYINARTKLRYRCSCGKESEITFYSFKTGVRCWDCGREKLRQAQIGSNHHSWVEDREALKEFVNFRRRCQALVKNSLRAVGRKKEGKTHAILGYSPKQLKQHIESFSSWADLKNTLWHVDHIFPIKAFVDYGVHDIALINCLENLQPLGYKENIVKSDNYDPVHFESWLKRKGVKHFKER